MTTKKTPKAKPKAAKTAARKRVDYTAELAEQILDQIIDGKTLKEIEVMPGMPSRTVVFKWRLNHEDFAIRYDKASDMRADGIQDDIEDVARLMREEEIEPNNGREIIAALKWAAAMRAPRRYSQNQKVEVSGKDGGPIVVSENPNRLLDIVRGIGILLDDALLLNGEADPIDNLLLGQSNDPAR